MGTETSAHKNRDTEVELRGLREAHTSLCDTEGTRKDPHKPLPSKLWPAVQGRTGNDPRNKQGAGGSEDVLREPL